MLKTSFISTKYIILFKHEEYLCITFLSFLVVFSFLEKYLFYLWLIKMNIGVRGFYKRVAILKHKIIGGK